ncbi:MAG: serine hydrolase [Candidatus Sumerlaeia bacterium]|nr:serine hydrolase [Candidatus Sumerlaeia bacterium]
MRLLLTAALLAAMPAVLPADRPTMELRPDVQIPDLPGFTPLPPSDPDLSEKLRLLVEEAGLDEGAPAESSPSNIDEVASIALVDFRDPANPRVADWNGDAFVYPASTYKMYVAGEAIRRVVDGEMSLDDVHEIAPRNVRGGSRPEAGDPMSLSEIIRLTMQYSDNTTANELIDIVDRHKASALMHALGCQGSEITRKFLPRNVEDEGFEDIMGTVTSGRHLATFLWAVEQGAIGGGKGRGLIKAYLAMNDRGRFYKGLPESATIHSKTGWWNIYTSEAAIIEDGDLRYILCVLSVQPTSVAEERMAKLAASVHAMLSE